MKQKMQNLSQKLTSGLRFITNPILRLMAALWAVTPLGLAWAALPPKARRAVKVFGLTFGLTWFAGVAWATNGGVAGQDRRTAGKRPGGRDDWSRRHDFHRRRLFRMDHRLAHDRHDWRQLRV